MAEICTMVGMSFEMFKRRSRAISTRPVIAIQNRGTLSLNAAAYALLQQVRPQEDMWVNFLFDRETKTVGLQPVDPESKDSYPVRKQPQSLSYLTTGRGFLAYYGIEATRLRRFEARIYDNTLVGFSLIKDELDKDAADDAEISTEATERGETDADAEGPLVRLAAGRQ
jgi:hypothetical protein